MAELYMGKRLSFDGQLCTVRFRGAVEGTKGEWLGVEWDDPSRGKHSGEHQGHRYFKCKETCFGLDLHSELIHDQVSVRIQRLVPLSDQLASQTRLVHLSRR
jgi:dynactin complex subunit